MIKYNQEKEIIKVASVKAGLVRKAVCQEICDYQLEENAGFWIKTVSLFLLNNR